MTKVCKHFDRNISWKTLDKLPYRWLVFSQCCPFVAVRFIKHRTSNPAGDSGHTETQETLKMSTIFIFLGEPRLGPTGSTCSSIFSFLFCFLSPLCLCECWHLVFVFQKSSLNLTCPHISRLWLITVLTLLIACWLLKAEEFLQLTPGCCTTQCSFVCMLHYQWARTLCLWWRERMASWVF